MNYTCKVFDVYLLLMLMEAWEEKNGCKEMTSSTR